MSFYIRGLTCLSKLPRPSAFYGLTSLQQTRSVVLRPEKVTLQSVETYEDKNERLKRPMSPHVTIYKMQFQAYLSIFHRITGLVTYGYVYLLAAGTFLPSTYPQMIQTLSDAHPNAALIYAAKFLIALPFSYHVANGIRHLMWDTGRFLTIPEVFKTGYAMLALALGVCTYILSL